MIGNSVETLGTSELGAAYAAGMTLGSRIRAARIAAGLTQSAVARRLNRSKVAVSQWEADIHRPSIDDRVDLSKLLDIPFSEMLPEADPLEGQLTIITDPDTQRLVRLWPKLGADMKQALMMFAAKFGLRDETEARDPQVPALQRRIG